MAAFWPVLRNDFVNWDDVFLLVRNPQYRGFSLSHLRWMFTTFYYGPYQPLCWLSFALDHALWGMDPKGYHLTSLLLHAGGAVLFYLALRRLLRLAAPEAGGPALEASAAFGALLFAIHPLRVESVAWASERRDVLSGLFYQAALLGYLQAQEPGSAKTSRRWLAGSVVAFTLSLLSKVSGAALPATLLVIDAYPLRRLPADPRRWLEPGVRRLWLEKLPYAAAALALGAAAIAGQAQAGAIRSLAQEPLGSRLALAAYGACFYIRKTLWPSGLSPLYEKAIAFDPSAPAFLLAGAAIVTVTAGLWGIRRRAPSALAAWVSYLATLAPVSGLLPIGPCLAADRYSYLPTLSFAALAAGVLLRLLRPRESARRAWPILLAALAAMIALGAATRRQTRFWRDSESLWRRALELQPDNSIAHNDLAVELESRGRRREAIEHYFKALAINPVYPEAKASLCRVLPAQAQDEAAAARTPEGDAARKAADEASRQGLALAAGGRLDEALAAYNRVLERFPADAAARGALARVLLAKGSADLAIDHDRWALCVAPALAPVRDHLGFALAVQHRYAEAAEQLEAALRLDPNLASAHNNLGMVLADLGRLGESAAHFRRALSIDPGFAQARKNLGIVLRGLPRPPPGVRSDN